MKPYERYQLSFTLSAADEYWNYMRIKFRRLDGTLCAAGYMKGAAAGKQGLVPNAQSYARANLAWLQGPLPQEVATWVQAERELMASLA